MRDCHVCHDLDVEAAFLRRSNLRHFQKSIDLQNATSILKSAEDGCQNCDMIATGIRTCHGPLPSNMHIIFEVGMPLRVESTGMDIEFYVGPGEWSPGPCIGEAVDISASINASESARMAKKWLDRCQQSHTMCTSSKAFKLPTRVVDVGPQDGSRDPCLVESGNKMRRRRSPYTALSYCWGSKENFVTKLSTLAQRKAGFPMSDLPQTIQDAIQVTRHLGIQYIWIDSLCIIQDDPRDWETEAARMGSIYEGAILAISATCASDVTEGFLEHRRSNSDRYRGYEIPLRMATRKYRTRNIYVRNRMSHSHLVPNVGATEGCPLLSRGWVFQERLLSTRTLHFLPNELLWECRCQFWCECMSVGADLGWKPSSMRGSQYNSIMSNPSVTDLAALWRLIIEDYTRRQLKFSKDNCPALSGIAHKFQNLGMKRYLAGLWEKDIFWSLGWQVDHVSEHPPRYGMTKGKATTPEILRSQNAKPSWSWISTAMPIRWHTPNFRALTERSSNRRGMPSLTDTKVVYAACKFGGQDPMGAVEHGTLVLLARVMTAQIRSEGKTYSLWRGHEDGTAATLIPDFGPMEAKLSEGDSITCIHLYTYKKGTNWSYSEKWTAIAVVPASQRYSLGSYQTKKSVTALHFDEIDEIDSQHQRWYDEPCIKYHRIGLVEGQKQQDFDQFPTNEQLRRMSLYPYVSEWFDMVQPRYIHIV